jgi:hypothetical protein
VSPITDHAGTRNFNKTIVAPNDSSAEQGKKIFKRGINSGNRRPSVVNSGIKIKLKAHKSSNGPEDNPSNNINLFTQEPITNPDLRKKNYNTGD